MGPLTFFISVCEFRYICISRNLHSSLSYEIFGHRVHTIPLLSCPWRASWCHHSINNISNLHLVSWLVLTRRSRILLLFSKTPILVLSVFTAVVYFSIPRTCTSEFHYLFSSPCLTCLNCFSSSDFLG